MSISLPSSGCRRKGEDDVRRATLLVSLSLVLAVSADGQKACDCDHFPWEPDRCVEVCGATLLNQVSREEMVTFLDFDDEVAQAIVEVREREPSRKFSSLRPLRESLSDSKFAGVKTALERLEPLTGQYLLTPPKEREEFRELVLSTNHGMKIIG